MRTRSTVSETEAQNQYLNYKVTTSLKIQFLIKFSCSKSIFLYCLFSIICGFEVILEENGYFHVFVIVQQQRCCVHFTLPISVLITPLIERR